MSESKIKELSALAERLRNRSLRVDPPPENTIEELRKENATLKRKYQKALQLLALYKQRLEVELVGSASDLLGRAPAPVIPRDPLLDIEFSSEDDDEEVKENRKFSLSQKSSSSSSLQKYMDLQKARSAIEARESLDLAASLNRDSVGSSSTKLAATIPPPPLPIEERIRDRN